MSDPARIGLLGFGTVGAAFGRLIAERADAIAAAAGRRPEVAGVLRRSEGEFEAILAESEIIVELIGGTDPARDYVMAALRAGRHVVTANKQLIAQFGDELFEAARAAGVQLRFEAAVAGVVPIIRVIQESLAAAEISKVFGIVNGTTNFILTEMTNTGATYAEALERAQELAHQIAALPQGAIRSDKESVIRGIGRTYEERLRIEAELTMSMFMRRDSHTIGASAFKRGERPEWPHHGL